MFGWFVDAVTVVWFWGCDVRGDSGALSEPRVLPSEHGADAMWEGMLGVLCGQLRSLLPWVLGTVVWKTQVASDRR